MLNFSTMPSVGRLAVVATSLLGLANAHMYLAEPKPMAGNAIKDPLDASGSNFPCHGADLSASSSGGQKISAGGSFPLQFELGGGANYAVHGGGSCQVSITYETDPVKVKDPKNWKVLFSIIGGCPANTKGNLNTVGNGQANLCVSDESGDCVHSWDVKVPEGVKSGPATLAMTWQNTIGKREFYMTCASVDIEGGNGSEMDSFPAMFVANLASIDGGKCPTTEQVDVVYPNPGKYVTTMSATDGYNYPKAVPTGDGCAAAGAAQPTGYGGGSSSSVAPTPSSSAYGQPTGYGAPTQAAPSSVASQVASGIASYDNQKGRETQTTFATSAAVTQSAVAAPSTAAPAPTGSSGSSNTSGSGTGSAAGCTPGAVGCNGPKQFGLYQDDCSIVWQDVAAGMACSNGAIVGAQRFRRHFHGVHKH